MTPTEFQKLKNQNENIINKIEKGEELLAKLND
jgi:hypothetical protein